MVSSSKTLTDAEKQERLAKLKDLLQPIQDRAALEAALEASGEDGFKDVALRRWLVARKWDVALTAKDLTEHAQWRREFCPKGLFTPQDIPSQLAQRKGLLQGVDKHGHPILIALVDKHIPSEDKHDKSFERYLAYCLDAGVRLGKAKGGPNWDGKTVGILYLPHMSMSNYDVAALRCIFDFLQHHYVERLHRLYLYCAPTLFWGLWKIVSPFVDPVTREKVVFVYEKEAKKIFEQDFGLEVLPPILGGTAAPIQFDEALKRLDEEQQQQVTANGQHEPAAVAQA